MIRASLIQAAAAALLFVLGPSCSEAGEREEMLRDLERNRASWEALGLTSYAVHERVSCFCAFGPDEVIVTVDGGEIAAVAYAETGQSLDTAAFHFYYTIDGLFDMLERAVREAERVRAAYDPTSFFPTEIVIDWIGPAVDDEISVVAGSLAR